jgi:vacuolar protein sorting-associated protein 1
MAIVTERLEAKKPPPPAPDPKTGKLAPGQVNNNKDLDVEFKKDEPSFFASFFSAGKMAAAKKKGGPVMESVIPLFVFLISAMLTRLLHFSHLLLSAPRLL